MENMGGLVFLENHSVYSLCEGTIFISELIDHAKARGDKLLSLCDTNGFYGVVNFVERCRAEGIQPIIGLRVRTPYFDGLFIARNMRGYSQISSLVSGVHLHEGFDVKREIRRRGAKNFFVITRDRDLLSEKREGVFAEVNVLRSDYMQDYSFAKKRHVPPVFISPLYFLKKEDYRLHRLLRAVFHNKKLSSLAPGEVQSEFAYYRDTEEIEGEYSFMKDALRNTELIANKSRFEFDMGKPIFPRYCSDSFSRLKNLCYANLKKRYSDPGPEVVKRLEKELAVIEEKGFADHFLVVHDIVKRSPYTCGRGSAAASIVSYLLFITHVDPIRHNLFFERFLNGARPDPPDIDIDFPWDTRDDILNYIFTKYTAKHAAMVSNHITFSSRSSVREVAKVCGIPENEINRVTKNIGHYYNRTSDEFEEYSKTRDDPNTLTSTFRKIFHDAVKIHGRPRYLSVHCGGVVITPKPIYYYIPVEHAAKGVNVIQLEKDQAEDFGFVKIDVLGNRSLAVVRDTLELVEKHYRKKIRYQHFNPLNDKKTVEMLATGETIGVFYVESPAMRQLQKKTGKGDYEHLVIHSSIIRPAANMYIREYIERLRGKPYTPLLPEMGEILKETYGIMCYQEDITRIALKIAGFPIGEADEIRKVILRKNKIRRKLELKDKFFQNLTRRGVAREITEKLWHMIESFSGYSFCKPHSASYALLSFKSCWLKARFPAEFMGAVLKNQGGYYSPLAYISEARRMGIKIELPDINCSRNEYYGRRDVIYIGFMQIKGLSTDLAKGLVKEREKRGRFSGLIDFMRRTGAGVKDTVLLIKACCFRNVETCNQPQLLYIVKSLRRQEEKDTGDLLCPVTHYGPRPTPPPMRDISVDQKLKNEQELFGFITSVHPMSHYRRRVKDKEIIAAKKLSAFVNQRVKVAGIFVTAKTVMTKNDELMQFVSFEDETAIFETVFFPETYKKYALRLATQRPYVLTGRVDEEFGVISLNVEEIRPLQRR